MHFRIRTIGLIALGIAIVLAACALAGVPPFANLWRTAPLNSLLVSGNIETHESVLSFSNVQARIVALPFDEGQWVEKGQLIARLDDSDYRQNVAVARSALKQAEEQYQVAIANVVADKKAVVSDQADFRQKSMDFRRDQTLWEANALSTQNRDLAQTAAEQSHAALLRDQALVIAAEKGVDAARAAVSNARHTLKLNRIILSYTILYAPFSGVILTRDAEIGEVMLPGTPVVTLADLDHVWLRAYINETDIGRVRYGQRAIVTTDTYPGKKYIGRISAIASKAEFTPKTVETHSERVTLVYRIKIDIYNPIHELVPGMPADAKIMLGPAAKPDGDIDRRPRPSG
jgi:HlyD family secretion protein